MKTTGDPKGDLFGVKVGSRLNCMGNMRTTVDIEDKRKEQPLMFGERRNSQAEDVT